MNGETKHFLEMLEGFETGMLITRSENGTIRSRPMAIADKDATGKLWFITSRISGKAHEMERDAHAAVTLQCNDKYVSMSGHGALLDDRQKLESLWRDSWRVWFPQGKSDPALALIEFKIHEADYWDQSGMTGLRFVWRIARSYLRGKRLREVDPGQHGHVSPA